MKDPYYVVVFHGEGKAPSLMSKAVNTPFTFDSVEAAEALLTAEPAASRMQELGYDWTVVKIQDKG